MKWHEKIGLEALWWSCRAVAALPYWVRYHVLRYLIFFVFRALRYRYKVTTANLERSLPELTADERRAVRRRFYLMLAEIFVDTVSMSGFTDEDCRRAIRVVGLDEQIDAVGHRDWIAMTAHLGCWEYALFWSVIYPRQAALGVYHPLASPLFDAFYKRLRTRANIYPVSMQNTVRYYVRHREQGIDGKPIAIGLISDQNPPKRPDSHWFDFLHQETLFFDGGEKLALRFSLPVYFLWLRRLRPGRYEMHFDLIYDGQEAIAPHEITERYVRLLEKRIREHPELWMWSHRRWKHKR